MADALEALAAQLFGPSAQEAITAENPYIQLESGMAGGLQAPFQIWAQNPSGNSLGEAALYSGLSGIGAGILKGLGADYQNTLQDRYNQQLGEMIAGKTDRIENLPDSLFGKAKQNAKLFGVLQGLQEQQDAKAISQYRKQKEIDAEFAKPDKEKDWWSTVPAAMKTALTGSGGQVAALRTLADRFDKLGGGPEWRLKAIAPDTPENYAYAMMLNVIPSTARLLGQTGNLNIIEQEAVKNATMGNILSDPKAIAQRLRNLADYTQLATSSKLEGLRTAATQGGDALLAALQEDSGVGKVPLPRDLGGNSIPGATAAEPTVPSETVSEVIPQAPPGYRNTGKKNPDTGNWIIVPEGQ